MVKASEAWEISSKSGNFYGGWTTRRILGCIMNLRVKSLKLLQSSTAFQDTHEMGRIILGRPCGASFREALVVCKCLTCVGSRSCGATFRFLRTSDWNDYLLCKMTSISNTLAFIFPNYSKRTRAHTTTRTRPTVTGSKRPSDNDTSRQKAWTPSFCETKSSPKSIMGANEFTMISETLSKKFTRWPWWKWVKVYKDYIFKSLAS